MKRRFEYDVALSFAGEDRPYVDKVANHLRHQGIKVFYDLFEETNLWGKNLYDYLADIYQNKARLTILFASENYAKKVWPNHERQSMQARALSESKEYVLPARFDDTEIPGLLPTIGYLPLKGRDPIETARLIEKKLIEHGASVPSEQLRRTFSISQATPRLPSTEFTVSVFSTGGEPIPGVEVAAVAENGTHISGRTDENGVANLSIPVRRKYTILCAHPEYPACVERDIDPVDNLKVEVPKLSQLASLICRVSCNIPGLQGHLNPILDSSARTYVYAQNIAVNGGQHQPVPFSIDEVLEMEDANGAVFLVSIKFIQTSIALLQYASSVY